MNDFANQYGTGKYDEILQLAAENEQFQDLLNDFSLHLILFAVASLMHSGIIIASGAFTAFWILYKLQTQQEAYSSNWFNIPLVYGYKYLLFGTLIGTVDYFAGNTAKNIVDEVFLSIGFRSHPGGTDE